MARLRPGDRDRAHLGARSRADVVALLTADPVTAGLVDRAWTQHCVPGVCRSFSSIARSYEQFCTTRKLKAWPASDYKVAAWLIRLSTRVKFSSMRMYLSGVRDHQLSRGFPWTITSSERIRRTLRWIKRAFPCTPVASKFAITHQVLQAIFPLLPGWPNLHRMDHDDRAFAVASVTGTAGFLRGGEFLHTTSSTRPLLRLKDISHRIIEGRSALVVSVPQPKTNWWVTIIDVPCYGSNKPQDPMDPTSLWDAYVNLSPAVRSAGLGRNGLPAFHFTDGAPLSREWMAKRTLALCQEAGVNMQGPNGTTLPLKAASWRAGGVVSAKQAGLSDSLIMFLGRWTSCAWRHYLLHTPVDVQGAAQRMWASTRAHAEPHHGQTGGASPELVVQDLSCVRTIEAEIAAHIDLASVARAAQHSRLFKQRSQRA
jgi:hypothetical protein